MSLKIWLPLTGNLENKGTANIKVENYGTVINSSGKIGECYSFDGVDDYIQLYNIDTNGWPEISVAFWCYPVVFGALFLMRAVTSHRLRINRNGFVFRDTNNDDLVGAPFVTVPPNNTWTHVVCVYNRGDAKIYINGELDSHVSTYYHDDSTLLSTGETRIARNQTSSSDAYYSGLLNDFRIYDHALSKAEVKELAKGLVCHYKLDDVKPRPNLLIDTNENTISAVHSENPRYWESGGKGTYTCTFEKIIDPPVPGIRYGVRQTVTQADGTHQMTFYSGGGVEIVVGNTYTMSCYVKCAEGNDASSVRFQYGFGKYRAQNVALVKDNQWHQYSWTFIAEEEPVSDGVTHIYCGGLPSIGEILICGYKLEEGDFATPWIPNKVEPLYEILYSDRICDSSGYGYHAVSIGNPFADSDTPRYRSCAVFDGTAATIDCGRTFNVQGAEEATFTGWFYISNWRQERSSYFVSSQQTGGILLRVINGTTIRARAHVYTEADKSEYAYKQADYIFTTDDIPTDSGWHMLTGVYRTSGIKVYLDGALKNTEEVVTYGIHFNMNANMFIGAECNGKVPSGFAECKASDVRLYYTALSDQDILELYQTCAKIDKSGQIHAGEFYECSKQAVRKTGVFESENFSEFCPSLKYDRKIYVELDGSKWVHIAHHNNPIESGLFSTNDTFNEGVYLDEDRWYDVEQTLSQLNTFEFMHKQKQYSTDSEVKYRWIQNVSPLTAVYSDVAPDKVTRIVTDGYTDGEYGGLYIKNGNARLSIADDVASHWFGAYGSWTSSSSGRIPGYSPLYIYSGYMDLYVRIDNQDLNVGAGFYRNGTINGNSLIET